LQLVFVGITITSRSQFNFIFETPNDIAKFSKLEQQEYQMRSFEVGFRNDILWAVFFRSPFSNFV
jgi:hypothetical protein